MSEREVWFRLASAWVCIVVGCLVGWLAYLQLNATMASARAKAFAIGTTIVVIFVLQLISVFVYKVRRRAS
jgi:hypothetical protein